MQECKTKRELLHDPQTGQPLRVNRQHWAGYRTLLLPFEFQFERRFRASEGSPPSLSLWDSGKAIPPVIVSSNLLALDYAVRKVCFLTPSSPRQAAVGHNHGF